MSKISKIEEYYIKNNPENLSIEDLAKELKRSKSSIEKVVDTKSTTEITKTSQVQNLMGRVRRKNKIVGAVMTEAASAAGDSLRKKSGISRAMREGTTKIYDE